MLIDQADIQVRGGKGGDGLITFRREKYVPRGGPSGGDGGSGGSVWLRADPQLRTLLDFTYKSLYAAEHGESGGAKQMTGRRGTDLFVRVPLGTVVYDPESGERLADLVRPGQTLLVARGGKGGRKEREVDRGERLRGREAWPEGRQGVWGGLRENHNQRQQEERTEE